MKECCSINAAEPRDIHGAGPSVQTLEHAKAGYENAQSVIRFMDTKAAAFIGLATLSLGLPLVVFQWLAAQGAGSAFGVRALTAISHWPVTIASLLALVGIVFGGISLYQAVSVLRARSPLPETPITILYPAFDGRKEESRALKSFSRIQSGMTTDEIAHEYELQIRCVGAILHEKGAHLRASTMWFGFQVGAYGLATASLVGAACLPLCAALIAGNPAAL